MNRKFIMLLFVSAFWGRLGYCQSTTKGTDGESPASTQTPKKELVPNDKKMDELSKKLLHRKKELEMDKARPEGTTTQSRKDNKSADKPKGDKK